MKMLSRQKISKIMKDMRLEEGGRTCPELIKYLVEHSLKRNVSNMFKAAVSTEQMLLKRSVSYLVIPLPNENKCT